MTRAVSAHEIELLLASLHGVRSARVLLSDPGRIDEIHVLCSPALQTKQVVRNVESALSAGLGIHVDRRIISVAQLRDDSAHAAPMSVDRAAAPQGPRPESKAPAAPADSAVNRRAEDQSATPAQSSAHRQHAPDKRFVFVGFDARTQSGTSVCRVSLRRQRDEHEGVGSGPNTLQGRAGAAAEALFDAVGKAKGVARIALDGAAIVELSARRFVLVSAVGAAGREGVQLTGIAALARSPEEAAILAALQAANRWAEPR